MENNVHYDKNLWFYHDNCNGKHFLIGNPHTFPGRMWAWCPVKKRTFFVSKSEIIKLSKQAGYWVKGFLSGNQPAPPKATNENIDYESEAYKNWQRKIEFFEDNGYWE